MSTKDTHYSTWTCDRCGITAQTEAHHQPPPDWRTVIVEVIGLNRSEP